MEKHQSDSVVQKLILTVTVVLSLLPPSGGFAQEQNSQLKQPIKVELKRSGDGWQLLRAGKPHYIKGAGGPGSLKLLAECGGNSNRTWGADEEIRSQLDEAHRLGLSVAVGIWLEHPSTKFNYNDFGNVSAQVDNVIACVRRFKDHPAVLVWGLGNEMEVAAGDNPAIWSHIEHLARLVKAEDPNHPTMSVIAEMGGRKIEAIHKLCPSLDIIGINSYGGATSIAERYRKSGGSKPYIVTEFGPVGTWEIPKNSFGAIEEPTSTEKAKTYGDVLQKISSDKELCLGSYAFLWGNKQEGTATWFGLLLPDGTKLSPVDVLTEKWSGKPPANRCPAITSSTLIKTERSVKPGDKLQLAIAATDPDGDKLTVKWRLMAEAGSYVTGGFHQDAPPEFAGKFSAENQMETSVQMPDQPGIYRIYAEVQDGKGASAVANVPVQVKGNSTTVAANTNTKSVATPVNEKVKFPFVVYNESGMEDPFIPSGYMGNAGALKLKPDCVESPFEGETCLQVEYKEAADWGGVVWQSPANDWGDQAGGFDLSGAKKFAFKVRGNKGGELVTFGVGLIGNDKKFFDTTKKETKVTLTKEWQTVEIELSDSDLTRIKSGFFFSLAGQGEPIKFFLDQIQYEKDANSASSGDSEMKPAASPAGVKTNLPFVVFAESGVEYPFIPSGFMGNTGALQLKPDCQENPFEGKTCLQVEYKEAADWGGVVWQSPANDWGDQAGGFDLTGTKKLSFKVRGNKGGEVVTFGVGLIKNDKKFFDTTKKDTKITLTKEWQTVEIELSDSDLSRIKSGFWFSLEGQGNPIKFYLDQIRFEGPESPQ